MATNTEEIPYLTFPQELNDDRYKNRKITFHVLKPDFSFEDVEKTLEMVKKKATDIFSGTQESPKSIKESKDNIEQNHYNTNKDSKHIDTIVLPLPNTLKDDQGHEWSTETGIVGTALTQYTNTSASDIAGRLPVVGKIAGKLVPNISVSQALGSAANSMNFRKPLADPGYFQNYNGTRPRNWNMTFDLIPNNAEEAKLMMTIIMKLKEYSSPEITWNGVSMVAPYFFKVDISNEYISAMTAMNGVVITNITIDYGADGNMQYFPDGIPKYIQMSISMAERRMMSANDYRKNVFSRSSQ